MRTFGRCSLILMLAVAGASCSGNLETSLERLVEARQLSADLQVQFTRAAAAGDHDARQRTQAIQRDAAALAEILRGLRYSHESRLLEQFTTDFADYLDAEAGDATMVNADIVALSVRNSDVRTLALSLGQKKRTLTARCQETLRALHSALAARQLGGRR